MSFAGYIFTSFVSNDYLKSFTPISYNVDINEILPHLEMAELLWTRELIGKELYDDLKTKFIAQTLNADEIVLVSLLKQHISYRSLYEALPFLHIKIRNKGTMKLTGENEIPSEMNEMKYLRSEISNKAEYFEKRVTEYLCLNGSKFPLWGQSDDITGINTIGTNQVYDSDIFTDDMSWNCLNRMYYGKDNSQ